MRTTSMPTEKDEIKHIENSSLVQLSRDLLEALVESSAILNGEKMTMTSLLEAKVVLGYLNASINATKTRMQWFRMTGLEDKIKQVKASSGKIK